MALTQEEAEILKLLGEHKDGLGQNELYRRVGQALEGIAKGTLIARLTHLQKEGRIAYHPGIRKGKVWTLTEIADATFQEWGAHIGVVYVLAQELARLLKEKGPVEERLGNGIRLYRSLLSGMAVEDLAYRHLRLSEEARQTEDAFHGMILQLMQAATDRFIGRLKPDKETFDAAIMKAFPPLGHKVGTGEEEKQVAEATALASTLVRHSFPDIREELAKQIETTIPLEGDGRKFKSVRAR